MMVFSGEASRCEERGALPAGTNFEIADTLVPAGTTLPPKRNWWLIIDSCVGLFPLELGAVGPDAMQDDGELARNRDFRLFGSNALDQLEPPCLER